MAASRSSRVTRSSVGLNGLDENFCGRTLRNRSIAQPEETSLSPLPRARSPKKRQESKQESKQDGKQESKQVVRDESKQDNKHDTKPESKRDSQHDGQEQASLPGKQSVSKALPAEVEQWSSSRKRGVSCLEKDITLEKPENCDTVKEVQDASPQIKRAKRCSRSGESQGQEEHSEPLKPESPVSVTEANKDNTRSEFSSQNSANPAPSSPISCKEGPEVMVAQAEDGHEECDGVPQTLNAHKASNGLKEKKAEELCTVTEEPCANATSAISHPLLLNGSQAGVPSSPDPAVPCTNSDPGQIEVSGSGESPASSAPAHVAAPEDPAPELTVAKEQEVEEVEVDVVGEPMCLAHEEQVMESDTNGQPLTPVQETSPFITAPNLNSSPINNGNSGESTPPLAKTPSPTEPGCNPSSGTSPCFTELYEHRYTLRTSPRRAATSKPSSPPRDNGPLREEGEVDAGPEEDCPAEQEPAPSEQEPAPSDCVGPCHEEQVSTSDPEDTAGGEASGSVSYKEAESDKGKTQSQPADEEEEEEEPDVYYFESDHLALKHNKEYVGAHTHTHRWFITHHDLVLVHRLMLKL